MGLIALGLGRRHIRQTTLIPAWWWAAGAIAAWSAAELAVALVPQPQAAWTAPLRLAVVGLSFCPIVAVLGAKRPQHAVWSFVVAAFWGMLALPAAETFLLQRGQRLEMGDARSWFLWLLVAVGPINYLPTRQWAAALLLAAGQTLALSEYLPLIARPLFSGQHVVGLMLAALASVMIRAPQAAAKNAFDRLWLDFRDTFGLLWSLRLQERVNSVAQTSGWPLELTWSGLQPGTSEAPRQPTVELDAPTVTTLRTTMRGLLRRFVSGDWIQERL